MHARIPRAGLALLVCFFTVQSAAQQRTTRQAEPPERDAEIPAGARVQPSQNTVIIAPRVLATLEADNGATITFLEPEEGAVLIIEEGRYPAQPVLQRADIAELDDPVQIHRAIRPQRVVPKPLVQAQVARVAIAGDTPEPEEADVVEEPKTLSIAALPIPPDSPGAPGPIKAKPAAPRPATDDIKSVPAEQAPLRIKAVPVDPKPDEKDTAKQVPAQKPGSTGQAQEEQKPQPDQTRAAWFQGEFCNPGNAFTYNWCWLNRTGSSTQQRWSLSMAPVVYSCGGTVKLQFQYKRFGKWKDYVSRDVLPGYYFAAHRTGIWRTRRARVVEADGNCYHFAGAGVR